MSKARDNNKDLEEIPVDRIVPNPENPRLMFRQGELDELQESIRLYGVQVPIAVYKDGNRYVLIDGERRWRCSSKLNKPTIPALVQAKPSPLGNLLLMFNIHSLREQWDLLTIALKLPLVIQLLHHDKGKPPTEADISSATGLSRGVIRRCKLLIDVPERYKQMLLEELKKPKAKQKLSEDLFIEMERSLTTVQRAIPGAVPDRDKARDALLDKYKNDKIVNIVDLRKVAKIARATKLGVGKDVAANAINRLIEDPDYTIDEAFNQTVSDVYTDRDIVTKIEGLIDKLDEIDQNSMDDEVREKLETLEKKLRKLLEET